MNILKKKKRLQIIDSFMIGTNNYIGTFRKKDIMEWP